MLKRIIYCRSHLGMGFLIVVFFFLLQIKPIDGEQLPNRSAGESTDQPKTESKTEPKIEPKTREASRVALSPTILGKDPLASSRSAKNGQNNQDNRDSNGLLAGGARLFKLEVYKEKIQLTINETVAMEFTSPIKRAAVSNDEIASVMIVSPKLLLITGKRFGFTQLHVWDASGGRMLFDIRVDVDMTKLKELIKQAAPRANVDVITMLDTVILTGTVPDALTAERIVNLAKVFVPDVQNQLSVAGNQQVLLRTIVAEVSRSAIRSLGLNGALWGTDAFGGSNIGGINATSIGLQQNTAIPLTSPYRFQIVGSDLTVNPSTTIYFGLPRAQMEMFLQALEQNGLIRVLAQPNLVAISGQSAEFVAGGDLPIPTPTQDGIAITYKEFGVKLSFQPIVQAGQIIRVKVVSEVSEPDYTNAVQISGLTIPGINKRKAETVVELGSDQSFAIAGLLSEEIRGVSYKFPGLGHLPVIGSLFRSVRFERSETELMVLVTPQIVGPLNAAEVRHVPGDDVGSPSNWELFGLGLIEHKKEGKEEDIGPNQPAYDPPAGLFGPWGMEER